MIFPHALACFCMLYFHQYVVEVELQYTYEIPCGCQWMCVPVRVCLCERELFVWNCSINITRNGREKKNHSIELTHTRLLSVSGKINANMNCLVTCRFANTRNEKKTSSECTILICRMKRTHIENWQHMCKEQRTCQWNRIDFIRFVCEHTCSAHCASAFKC